MSSEIPNGKRLSKTGYWTAVAGPSNRRNRHLVLILCDGEVVHRAWVNPNRSSEIAHAIAAAAGKTPMDGTTRKRLDRQIREQAQIGDCRRKAVVEGLEEPTDELPAGLLRGDVCPCCNEPLVEGRDYSRAFVHLPQWRKSRNLPPEFEVCETLAEGLLLEAGRLTDLVNVLCDIARDSLACNASKSAKAGWNEVRSRPDVVDHLVERGLLRRDRPTDADDATDAGPVARPDADAPEP